MERDRQIELLANASERAQGRIASWLQDPRVKDVLRRNHDATREIKNPRPTKRVCG